MKTGKEILNACVSVRVCVCVCVCDCDCVRACFCAGGLVQRSGRVEKAVKWELTYPHQGKNIKQMTRTLPRADGPTKQIPTCKKRKTGSEAFPVEFFISTQFITGLSCNHNLSD